MPRKLAMILVVLGAVSGVSPAGAQGTVIFTGPGSYLTTYTTPVMAARTSGELLYGNGDIQPHDVVSEVNGPDTQFWCDDPFSREREFPLGQCPLFWTPLIGLGATSPVYGLENLVPGTLYDFYCSIHPNMLGILAAAP